MVEEIAVKSAARRLDVVVGASGDDVIGRLAVDQANGHLAGRMIRVGVQPLQAHPPVEHGRADLAALGIIAHGTLEIGLLPEGIEVPGDVEGGTAEHGTAIGKPVVQDFPEDTDGYLAHGSSSRMLTVEVEAGCGGTKVRGRRCV